MKNLRIYITSILCVILFVSTTDSFAAEEQGFGPLDLMERRDKLAAQITDGVAIITNYSGVLARTRTDPEFLYLTGVQIPGAKLILIPQRDCCRIRSS